MFEKRQFLGTDDGVFSFPSRPTTTIFFLFQVSYPQYLHLKSLQKKVMKLDKVMDKISEMKSPEELEKTPQWGKLQRLRQSLAKLLPIGANANELY